MLTYSHKNKRSFLSSLVGAVNTNKESNIPEMISVAGTIDNWLEEVVNSLKNEQYNNGFTEANNNVIDKIISVSYGYKNFEFFRLRALTILRKSYSGESQKNIENGKLKK